MPTFQYKAMTKTGHVVKNTVSGLTKAELVSKLKNNDLVPIDIEQVKSVNPKNQERKNKTTESVAKRKIKEKQENKNKISEIKEKVLETRGITKRDIMVFTQNFLLLKKADFNNIHALNTIIDSTENPRLKDIIEDILSGVENRRIHVYYNGIL